MGKPLNGTVSALFGSPALRVIGNTLTWTPMALEETWSVERMDKEGLYILPPSRSERPNLGDFTVKEVDLALHNVLFFRENRLIKLLELKKTTPEYIAPVTATRGVSRISFALKVSSLKNQAFYPKDELVIPIWSNQKSVLLQPCSLAKLLTLVQILHCSDANSYLL